MFGWFDENGSLRANDLGKISATDKADLQKLYDFIAGKTTTSMGSIASKTEPEPTSSCADNDYVCKYNEDPSSVPVCEDTRKSCFFDGYVYPTHVHAIYDDQGVGYNSNGVIIYQKEYTEDGVIEHYYYDNGNPAGDYITYDNGNYSETFWYENGNLLRQYFADSISSPTEERIIDFYENGEKSYEEENNYSTGYNKTTNFYENGKKKDETVSNSNQGSSSSTTWSDDGRKLTETIVTNYGLNYTDTAWNNWDSHGNEIAGNSNKGPVQKEYVYSDSNGSIAATKVTYNNATKFEDRYKFYDEAGNEIDPNQWMNTCYEYGDECEIEW